MPREVIIECDRCHNEIKEPDFHYVEMGSIKQPIVTISFLCEECYKKIQVFIEEKNT